MEIKYGDVINVFREYFPHKEEKKIHTDEQYGNEMIMQNKQDEYLGRPAFIMPMSSLLELKFPRYMYFPLRSAKKDGCVHYVYHTHRKKISKYIATRQIGNISDKHFVRLKGFIHKRMNLANRSKKINEELNKTFQRINKKNTDNEYHVGDLINVRFKQDTLCVVLAVYPESNYICVLQGDQYYQDDEKLSISTFVLNTSDTGLEKKISIRLYLARTIDKRRVNSTVRSLDLDLSNRIVSKFMKIMESVVDEV